MNADSLKPVLERSWLERHTDNVEVGSSRLPGTTHRQGQCVLGNNVAWDYIFKLYTLNYKLRGCGGLAQLARALAWHARGQRCEPDILHKPLPG